MYKLLNMMGCIIYFLSFFVSILGLYKLRLLDRSGNDALTFKEPTVVMFPQIFLVGLMIDVYIGDRVSEKREGVVTVLAFFISLFIWMGSFALYSCLT